MLLAVDTVHSFCSVAVASARGDNRASFHRAQNRGHAETLVPLIQKTLLKADGSSSDIRRIIVTTGPGTFAGVRIGISAAKAIAFVTDAKILGVSSFEALAGLALMKHEKNPPRFILSLMPGRGAEWGAELFVVVENTTPPFQSVYGPHSVTLEILEEWLKGKTGIVAGPQAEKFLNDFPVAGFQPFSLWPTAKNILAMEEFFPSDRWQKSVSPFYLRPPDATPSVQPSHG